LRNTSVIFAPLAVFISLPFPRGNRTRTDFGD
jgi:hypothetical protein